MKLSQTVYDVIIIGGGASGMMTAISAAESGKKVLIVEKNKSLGQKLSITGGGRCNITNGDLDVRSFLKNYKKAEPFLYSPFAQFSVQDTFTFFESRGLPLVIQARKRVFPKTERATDVCNLMVVELQKLQVAVLTGCSVKKIKHSAGMITGLETTKGAIAGTSYVLATGGLSHPETGSTGDGFTWLQELGHTVTSPTPTIVPLSVADTWITSIPGVSLSFMKITFFLNDKKQFAKTGKILFTHFGISGPLILNSSGQVADLLPYGKVTATIDAYPDTTIGDLESKIIALFDENKNKMLKTIIKDFVPQGMHEVFPTLLPIIDWNIKVHSVTKEHRKLIVHTLKTLPVTITGLMGFDRAVVADGGVDLQEIDMKTMRSKKINNLYITGDLLNIVRPSGGYSLQLCWTTGYVAGKSA